ncbi:kinase-like domain-containing protein, partial [Phlyctochytrium arcticum]
MGPPDFPFPRSPQAQKQPHLNRTRFVEKGGIASAIGPKRKSALAMTRSHSHEGTVTITNSPQTPQQQRHSRLLLVSLLENFCTLYANESSPELTQNLFRVLCGQLQRWGIIEPEDFGDEVYALRGGVKRAFRELVVRAMEVVRTGGLDDMPFGLTPPTEIPPNSNPSPRPTSFFNSHLPPHLTDLSPPLWDTRTSRYTDDFVQLQPLGHGAFGHVYKVRNRLDGVEYAVKKIKIRLGGNTAAGRLDRILREVKFQARLAHPNIVRYYSAWVEEDLSPRVEGIVFGYDEDDEMEESPCSKVSSPKVLRLTLFIQMELCNQTLQSYLQRRNVQKTPQVHLPTVRRIFRDIVLGVAVIHAMGCVHRDVNPRNVYWKEAEGVWKVGDFGLVAGGDAANDTADNGRAGGLMNDMFGNRNVFDNSTNAGPDGRSAPKPARRRRGSTSSNADGIVGTVTYASPEQRQHMIPRNIHHHPSKAAGRNTIPTPASDIYSLGIILYELLQPFSTAMERSRSLATLRAGLIPERFIERYPVEAGWIFCMMRTDPRARPGAAEV